MENYIYIHQDVIHEFDEKGYTPLHEAARGGNTDIISFLCKQGAKITETTIGGQTPLDIAKQFADEAGTTKHIEFIRKLMGKDGADPANDEL